MRLSPIILVVDVDEVALRLLGRRLASDSARLLIARNADDALAALTDHRPDIVLMGAGMPESRDLLPMIRRISTVPIIIMAPRLGWEGCVIEELTLGADAFVLKPPDRDVLLALIDAQLRRAGSLPSSRGDPLVIGDLIVDLERRMAITRQGEILSLCRKEWELLSYFALHKGQILTFSEILTHVWGAGYGDEHHLIHDWVSRLRRKLRDGGLPGEDIETIPGIGYRLPN